MCSAPWSREERERISNMLNELLPSETVNSRPSFGEGAPRYYLRIAQARALANDIFGPDQWHASVSSSYTDEDVKEDGTHEIVVSCTVRITLRDGTFREDVGSCAAAGPGRAETMRKASSIAASDATLRALRLFGPALGNCLADSSYTRWLAANPTAS